MSEKPYVPQAFAHLVNLASDLLGTFVMYATDDYFAEKENLLKPGSPQWIEGAYTDKGKWMDGWESQRKREPGHDFAILRLGVPGRLEGLLVDTTHFKGNAPQSVSLEVIEAGYDATAAQLLASDAWREALPQTAVKPDFPNVISLTGAGRATHVKLHIYPDGGVARLRVYGTVEPEDTLFWQAGSLDLAAVENGGTVAAVSDEFFGPPSNLLLPGRGVNMGDGWETKRRRTPGSDWAVIKLARRGVVERVELDTHFFKGNAPQATLIEALDATDVDPVDLAVRLRAPSDEGYWRPFLSRTPLVQHRRHVLTPERPMAVTHLRVHIYPHGGVNRMRLFGHALDTASEHAALGALNTLPADEAATLLRSFNGAPRFAEQMLAARPFSSVREVFGQAERIWWGLDALDFQAAFAAHPRIGQTTAAPTQTARSAGWSASEQAGVAEAAEATRARLAALNDAYFERFGFIFIVCASGRSAGEMLALLEARLPQDRESEMETAAREQAKITRLRIARWIRAHTGGA